MSGSFRIQTAVRLGDKRLVGKGLANIRGQRVDQRENVRKIERGTLGQEDLRLGQMQLPAKIVHCSWISIPVEFPDESEKDACAF